MDIFSPNLTSPSDLTLAYHRVKEGYFLLDISENSPSLNEEEIVLHGGADVVISNSTFSNLKIVPGSKSPILVPASRIFSPVLPG
jgi:hypothetical protein